MNGMLAQSEVPYATALIIAVPAVLAMFLSMFFVRRYHRCPSNQILVVYGAVGPQAAKCFHGGGTMVWPVIQDCAYLSLEPHRADLDVTGVASDGSRLTVRGNATVCISTDPQIMQNAAERLLGLAPSQICTQARDILAGNVRRAIAQTTADAARAEMMELVDAARSHAGPELGKLGLEIVSLDFTDIAVAVDTAGSRSVTHS
jgi:flotillin